MPAIEDPEESAHRAGLVHVSPDEPGLRRVRHGTGFGYRTSTGRTLRSERVRSRIEELAIPPAWTDVWICASPEGHIQAVGRDDRGRLQYRYHDRWTEVRGAAKFAQLEAFGRSLPDIRRQVTNDLADPHLSRRRVIALVIALLDDTLLRVGNTQYVADDSFGLTTLLHRHVHRDDDAVRLDFVGKGGIEHEAEVTDPDLVNAIVEFDEAGGQQLFTYEDADGLHDLRSDDVNERLREIARADVSARDFRTWGGTVAVVEDLGPVDPSTFTSDAARSRRFLEAIDRAAELLGNTRTVCRGSYAHPVVERGFETGGLHDAWRRSRRSSLYSRAERATLRLLGGSG